MPVWRKNVRVTMKRKTEFTVRVGQGQISSSIVNLGNKELVAARKNSFTLNLGSDVIGKTLTCSTLVHDINPNTNKTAVIFTISNAGNVTSEKKTDSVAHDGGIVYYRARIKFFK